MINNHIDTTWVITKENVWQLKKLPLNLKRLFVMNIGLTYFPSSLPDSLEELHCQNNLLTILPHRVPSSLKILNCSGNPLNYHHNLSDYVYVLNELHCSRRQLYTFYYSLHEMGLWEDDYNQTIKIICNGQDFTTEVTVPRPVIQKRVKTTGLTEKQMILYTKQIPYSIIKHGNETNCSITMEEFAEGEEIVCIKSCKHIFKPNGIQMWLQTHKSCPVCRHQLKRSKRT
jgi:hypothetical protein